MYRCSTYNTTSCVGPLRTYVGNEYSVLQYTYNNNGYVTQKQDTKVGQSESYTYDALGRLTGYTVNGTLQRTFSYSNNGNITQNSALGSGAYSYGSKPHAVSGIVMDAGVMDTTRCAVTYNAHNRPESIGQGLDSVLILYGDGLERESETWKHGATTQKTVHFLFGNCEEEVLSGGTRYVDYIMADGRVVALHVKNGTQDSLYFVHTDMLGGWVRVTNANKAVVQSSHFDPWGNRMTSADWTVSQDGTSLPFKRGFTGHEHYDQFRIINMNARLYDPVIGRFFSPDPLVQNPYSTQGLNRYSYCGNNPVMYSDPTGEFLIIGGLINYFIHKKQGDVTNFWKGFGYFSQGMVGGLFFSVSPFIGSQVNAISTVASLISNPQNAKKIMAGLFYFDEQMGHGFSQAITRFTKEAIQTWAGYNYTQFRNLGGVDRVDYLGGATFATNEDNGTITVENHKGTSSGVTIGGFINMSIPGQIDKNFREYVLSNQIYMHEYGHTLQSQMLGPAYLGIIGLPSLISCSFAGDIEINGNTFYSHDLFYTELSANTYAYLYFSIHYNFNWENNWRNYPRWSDLFRL